MKPAIVIVAFNRPHSLKRLLNSIQVANYISTDIPLCICIDYQESKLNVEVLKIAKEFVWNHGDKKVIHQEKNLGLKKHVLLCGNIVKQYGAIIMLEDDITVSQNFYTYSTSALSNYDNNPQIAGISLYNHKRNFNNQLPFEPLKDNSDIYFLQIASSWGQAWTEKQWLGFMDWFEKNDMVHENTMAPNYIISWPKSSWLKHFIHYLAANKKYFVFPRVSFSTNWSDAGSHNKSNNTFFQVPLETKKTKYTFHSLEESLAVYDCFFEILPSIFTQFNHDLKNYDFEVDLYGLKPVDKICKPFVLTSKKGNRDIFSFGLQLKPMELNIFNKIEGDFFRLSKLENVRNECGFEDKHEINVFNYTFGLISLKTKVKNLMSFLKTKFL